MKQEQIEALLAGYPGHVRHRVSGGPGAWVVVLVSNVFEGHDEAERQAEFWRYLEQRGLEPTFLEYAFLFTDTEDLALENTAAQ